jgi:hypothetical protein
LVAKSVEALKNLMNFQLWLNDSRDLGEFWARDNSPVRIRNTEIKSDAVTIRFMI